MKHNIFFIFFLISLFSFSQEVKEEFKGEIHSITEIIFDDEAAFKKDAESYMKTSDSIVTIDYNSNSNSKANLQYVNLEDRLSSNRFGNMISLGFKVEGGGRPKIKRWMFSQTFIKMHTSEQKPLILARRKGTFLNHYKYNPKAIKKELSEYRFSNSIPKSVVVDTNDVKNIAGVKCFKVTVTYESKNFKLINDSNQEIINEMYVTDSIKSKYNPMYNNLAILNRFYPMYVKSYNTGLRGRYYESKILKVASLRLSNLKELQNSYQNLKDSILAKYPPLITIEDIQSGNVPSLQKEKKKSVPFKEQLEVFESLGYKLNARISLKDIEHELIINGVIDTSKTSMKAYFKSKPYSALYYYMGWTKYEKKTKEIIPYTDNCIWYDLEFIDSRSEYITLMKRMGEITDGELSFSNMSLSVDENNYDWLSFEVNGVKKKWKLQKVGYIADSFFSRFAHLTEELNTKGRYTYFCNGSQQFVIDYATPKKQKEFIVKTGLQREWLTAGKYFSKPKN